MRIEYSLLVEVIDDITLYIPKLVDACESASELFYEDVTEETWAVFQQVLSGYEDLYKVLQMTYLDGQEHKTKWYKELDGLLEVISTHFIQLSEEINSHNYVGIGDLIKFEWAPLLEDILKLFKEKN